MGGYLLILHWTDEKHNDCNGKCISVFFHKDEREKAIDQLLRFADEGKWLDLLPISRWELLKIKKQWYRNSRTRVYRGQTYPSDFCRSIGK